MSQADRIRAAVFDFDGTLAEVRIDFPLMRARVLDALGIFGVQTALLQSRYVLELIEEGVSLLESEDVVGSLRAETTRIMEEVEMEAAEKASPFPWVQRMALELAEDGISRGVVTRNCRRAVSTVLGEWGALFQCLITRDEVSSVKPDPRHPWQALALLPEKIPPRAALMIGDHPMDVLCARKAGMCAVGVMSGAGTAESLSHEGADFILPDASHLPELIRNLNGDKKHASRRQ